VTHLLAAAVGAVTAVAALAMSANHAEADGCRASLVTGIDVSASTGADGVQMQVDGLSDALRSPAVLNAFQSQGCVRIAVYLWSEGPSVVVLPWIEVASAEDAENAIQILRTNSGEYEAPTGVPTDVSGALESAEALLGQIPPTGRQVANIVTDGEDNVGEGPELVATRMRAAGITINAVVFGPSATIETYYRERVAGGSKSFVMRVRSADDFAAIYRAKFILDVSAL
jgi:Ca-activated chloride channel family protein